MACFGNMCFNKFRKIPFKSNDISEAALNAGIVRNLLPNTTIPQTVIDERAPFLRLHIENRNANITLLVSIGGQGLGDNTIQFSIREFRLLAGEFADILPEEDNLQFTMIAIKNLDGALNFAAGDIHWDIGNI